VVVEDLQGGQLTFDVVLRAEGRFSAEPQHQGQVTLLGGDGEVDSEVDSEVYEVHWHEVVVDISFVRRSLPKVLVPKTCQVIIVIYNPLNNPGY
jgi:hypothetical protein